MPDLDLTRRLVKGTPLTAEDYDTNLDKLEDGLTDLETALTAAESEIDALQIEYVRSVNTTTAGADRVRNIISLTQTEYDAILAPVDDTLYIITD